MPIRGSDRPQTCGLRARFPDCLSTHRFACFDGQQSGRECIFLFRTALRFACAVFRACALRVLGTSALRAFTFLQAFASTVRNRRSASLASSLAALVAHWAHFGLFRALRAAFVRPAKNTRNDVHAVISDESLVLPILCQCSEPRMSVTHAHPRLFPLQFCAAYGAGVAAGAAGSMEGSETTAANRMELVSAS